MSATSAYIVFALFGAALFISISLMDTGVKRYLPGDKQRLIILAVGYGIQLIAVVIALCSFVPEIILKALQAM